MKKRICGLLIFLFASVNLAFPMNQNDEVKAWVPKHYVAQYAGNLGLFSVGVGNKLFSDKAFIGIMYGYLPQSVNDAEVHTVAAKLGYVFYEREPLHNIKINSYVGTSLIYTITKNTYIKYPDCFPEGYYKPNAIHAAPFIGSKVSIKYLDTADKKKWIGFYCEIGTIDDYLYNLIASKGEYSKDIWNVALGVGIDIN